MKLRKIETTKNGEIETTWMLSPEQYHNLLQHAINDLTMKGVISTINLSEAEVADLQKEALEEIKKQFLENLDVKEMSNA
jgi:hypothetical protein